MTQPQSSDRKAALERAIRSLKILGLASAAWGLFFVFAWGYFNRFERFRPIFIAMGLIIWLVPGVLCCLLAWMIETQRRRGPAIWAMIVVLVQCLFAGVGFGGSIALPPVSPIPIVMFVLWILALVQLFIYLRRSLPLLASDVQRRHGFDITPVRPLTQTDHSTDSVCEN